MNQVVIDQIILLEQRKTQLQREVQSLSGNKGRSLGVHRRPSYMGSGLDLICDLSDEEIDALIQYKESSIADIKKTLDSL